MEPVPWLKVASDKLKKADNCSWKEGKDSTSITDNSISAIAKVGLSLGAWHIKKISAFVFVRAPGFLCLNLTFPMETRAVVYKALFGPRFRVCRDCLTPCLTDAVMKGVKVRERVLWDVNVSSCITIFCVREVGSQLFRAAGNTETASLTLFILPL